jgi:hypothetical protein
MPFRERHVASVLLKSLKSVGEGDRALADELAAAVMLFLSKFHEDATPAEADVHGMLVRVLDAKGHGPAARHLERTEGERQRMESELLVRQCGWSEDDQSRDKKVGTTGPWNRGRLQNHLSTKRGLPQALAEEVAVEVEMKMARLSIPIVTSSFLRDMI